MKQKVWIVGANGAIGFELVKIYLKNFESNLNSDLMDIV